jgi:carbamoyl-phosphate synthase large subunit
VKDADKQRVVPLARDFIALGFGIIATGGTAATLEAANVDVTRVFKLREGRPHVLDRIKNGDVQLIINTPSGKIPREDEMKMRSGARLAKIPIITTMRAAQASVKGIRSLQTASLQVKTLQEYHVQPAGGASPATADAATAAAHQHQEQNGADNGNADRAETAEPVGKEGEHTGLTHPR